MDGRSNPGLAGKVVNRRKANNYIHIVVVVVVVVIVIVVAVVVVVVVVVVGHAKGGPMPSSQLVYMENAL